MLKSVKVLPYFVLLVALTSCSKAQNYPDAEAIIDEGKTFIKLKGKRGQMAHDIISLFSSKTYEDSILILVPSFNDGIIKGEDVSIEKGHYKYLGELSITGNRLKVNLFHDNTDDKRVEPTSWNGKYNLVRK